MRVLKGSFIEFGDFVIANDHFPIAIVSGDYEIVEMEYDQFKDNNNFDWIDLDSYKGQIVFNKGIL